MDNIMSPNFKCFRHPLKKVEAVCTEPYCNCYRFFCVQCFFEFSSHFISHKHAIHEIGDVLAQHQGSSFKNSVISELQQGLNRAKSQVKDYEQVIKTKHASYMKVISEVERQFLHAKDILVREIEDYLSNLVIKQHQHYGFLENKMKSHLQESPANDWVKMNSRNEAEITGFFENIIKAPGTSAQDLLSEVGLYLRSFKRNIQDLDNQSNSKMVSYFAGEFSQIFHDKFKELKQLLIMSTEEVQVQNSCPPFVAKLSGMQEIPSAGASGDRRKNEEFWMKNKRTPSSSLIGFGFGKGEEFNSSSCIEVETASNNIFESRTGIHSTVLPRRSADNTPSHTDGICSIIVFQESPTKKIIATGSKDCSVKFWQLESSSFEYIKTLEGHSSPVLALCKIEKEENLFLASAAEDGSIKIWNPILQGKELLASFSSHSAAVISILYADEFLITGSLDKTMKIWNLDELFCQQTLTQDEEVNSLCALSRGTTKALVSGCGDGFRIWNQKKLGEYKLKSYNNKAHKKGISFITPISANGIDIATAGKDGLIKLWNMERGICVIQLEGHTRAVYQLIFSPSTGNLFSSSCDETIREWDLEKQVHCFDNGSKFKQDCQKMGEMIIFEKDKFLLSATNDCCAIKTIYI